MGTLSDFDLGQMIEQNRCRYLIETGTGGGSGVAFASKFPFEHVYSIEIMHSLAYEVALRHSKNLKITIFHGKSERGLTEIIEEIPPDAPVIYWLDAHFPGADHLKAGYASETNEAVRLPLERELRLVAGLRDISRDIFLVDDLRIYEDGNYPEGPCPPDALPASPELRDLRFFDEVLGETHRIERIYKRTGYICAYPKT
jgi:hypothetical protein